MRKKQEEERERLERQQRLEEERRIWAEKMRKIKEEQERVSKLITDAENWHKSELIREYIKEVAKHARERKCNYLRESDFNEWLKWAHIQADRLDPLTPSPPSILDATVKEPKKDNEDWNGSPFNSRY